MASRTLERKKRIDYKKMIQGEPWISDNEVEEEDKLSSATVLEVPKPCGISGENQASEEKDESDVETMKEELLMLEKEEKLLQAQQEKALLRQKLREKREAIKALKEFGKSHCLPRHGSGFKVVQLKKEKPLTPIVEAFHVPLPNTLNSLTIDTADHARRDSDLTIKSDLELSARYSSKQTTPSSRFSSRMTEYTTPAYHAPTDESQYTAQQIAMRDNSAILTFPDTPDGSDVSNDSNSNEYIEVTIYEEEVGDSVTGESTEGCIVLTDLSKSYVSSSSSTAQLNRSEDLQCAMNYRVNQATGSTIPYMYNPLTPP